MSTITITLTEAEARAVVSILSNHPESSPSVVDAWATLKSALPPEWAEGTIAWVTQGGGGRWIAQLVDGQWRAHVNPEWDTSYISNVVNVEPLRVLADDEIAVKRIDGGSAKSWRDYARFVDSCDHPAAVKLCRAYATALDAADARAEQ